MLSKSIDNVVTECIVFPKYEVSLPSVLFSYNTEVTVSRWGYRLEANWYPSFNSIQCEQSKLKQSSSMPPSQAAAVEAFSEWLANLVREKEAANENGGLAGKAKIVLCGHRCVPCIPADDSVTTKIR